MIKEKSFWTPVKPVKRNKRIKPTKLFGFAMNPEPNHHNYIQPKTPISPVKLHMYPKRNKAETRLIDKKPFGDRDRDRVPNYFDCKPLNKKKQGWAKKGHTFNREETSHIKMMKPEKFLRTTQKETLNKEAEQRNIYNKKQVADSIRLGLLTSEDPEEYVKSLRYSGGSSGYSIKKLKNVIKSKKGKMSIPYLLYDKQGRPTGHEGRHRAIAAQELGVKLMPVTIGKKLKSKEYRDWKKIRDEYGAKKNWKLELDNEDEVVSTKSADIPIKEQRRYGEERPEVLESLNKKEPELIDKSDKTLKRKSLFKDKRAYLLPDDEENDKPLRRTKEELISDKHLEAWAKKRYSEGEIKKRDEEEIRVLQKKSERIGLMKDKKSMVFPKEREIEIIEDVKEQAPSQDIIEDSIESDKSDYAQDLIEEVSKEDIDYPESESEPEDSSGDYEEKYEGSAQELIDESK